jgi:hypothetical protein
MSLGLLSQLSGDRGIFQVTFYDPEIASAVLNDSL